MPNDCFIPKAAAWFELFEAELANAESARLANNEGMARVCARRAAGIAIGEFIRQQDLPEQGLSAYDRLSYLTTLTGISTRAVTAAQYLLLRVDEDFQLPVQVDLIVEARTLADELFKVSSQKVGVGC